jgi:hypothetical protein
VRAQVTDWEEKHLDDLRSADADVNHPTHLRDVLEYSPQEMAQSGFYATHAEVTVAAILYNAHITVHYADEDTPPTVDGPEDAPPERHFHLLWHRHGEHYQVLLPALHTSTPDPPLVRLSLHIFVP